MLVGKNVSNNYVPCSVEERSHCNNEEKIINLAKADEKVQKYLEPGIRKTIFIPKAKLLNFVV